ncbi:MAG: GNAT family N-acetyltransferase [Anaerolineaceae bacterium]
MKIASLLPTPVPPLIWRFFDPADAAAVEVMASAMESAHFPVAALMLRGGLVQALADDPSVSALCACLPDDTLAGFFWLARRSEGTLRLDCTLPPGAVYPGLEAALLDWAEAAAQGTALEYSTENLTPTAEALLEARGYIPTMVEEVMHRSLSLPLPDAPLSAGVRIEAWAPELADRFFAVYQAAFRERPGFPGWSQPEWVDWVAGGDDFSPECSLLASEGETPLGFLASDVSAGQGWISQMGVVPAARGRGLAQALLVEAMRRFIRQGCADAYLDVNANNPRARRVYADLGFVTVQRRGRYRRQP